MLVEVNDAVQLQIVHLTLKYTIFKDKLFVSHAIGHPLQIDETVEQDEGKDKRQSEDEIRKRKPVHAGVNQSDGTKQQKRQLVDDKLHRMGFYPYCSISELLHRFLF